MVRKTVLTTLLLGVTLAGCQTDNDSEPEEPNEPETEEVEPDEEQTDESDETTDEGTSDEDTDESEEDSDQDDSNNTNDIAEQDYSNKDEAADAIDDYEEIEETNTDLGHGIEASMDAGTGHQYVMWNEGNWLIKIDFPLDPEMAIDKYKDGESMAREIIDYLEENRLPAPKQHGVIDIRSFKDEPKTIIRWQEDDIVYEIEQEVEDPIDALQIAVDYENNQ